MGAIWGEFKFEREAKIAPSLLEDMSTALSHRGSIDKKIYVDKNIGLGAASNFDTEYAHSANFCISEERSLAVVFEGRIYNREDLRELLATKGVFINSEYDAPLLLKLYENFKENFFSQINGMFAMAIYDKKDNKLILAVDHFGIKPIYYYIGREGVIFGSTIAAILKDFSIKKELDLEGLNDYFSYRFTPAPRTIFRNIYKVPQASYLIFKDRQVTSLRYWDIIFKENKIQKEEYYKENLRMLIFDSVKRRSTENNVGAFLSGGIDSTTIMGVLASLKGPGLKTFSLFLEPESGISDRNYAHIASKKFSTAHFEIKMGPESIDTMEEVVSYLDEPLINSFINKYYLCRLVSEHTKVVLSGTGSDALFGAHDYAYRGIFLSKLNNVFPMWFRRSILKALPKQEEFCDTRPIYPKVINKLSSALEESLMTKADFMEKSRRVFTQTLKEELYTQQFKDILDNNINTNLVKDYYQMFKLLNVIDGSIYIDLNTDVVSNMQKLDRISAACGIEVRVPFLDYRIVQFIAEIPYQYKIKKEKKYILKKTMEDLLPSQILQRKKLGMGYPYHWFNGPLREKIRALLLSDDSKLADFIDRKGIENLIDAYQHKGLTEYGASIWALLVFELWVRKHLGGQRIV